jgi:hypothetical protein
MRGSDRMALPLESKPSRVGRCTASDGSRKGLRKLVPFGSKGKSRSFTRASRMTGKLADI